jgi:hypothetical protein
MGIPTDVKATIEQLREVFSVGSLSRLYNENKLPRLALERKLLEIRHNLLY